MYFASLNLKAFNRGASSDPERVEGARAVSVQSFANKFGMYQSSVSRAVGRGHRLSSEKYRLLDVERNA